MKRFLIVAVAASLGVWSVRASFTVQANLPWQDSNLPVVAGQWYTLTASGSWTGGEGEYCGPTGITWNPGYNVWVGGPHWSALVASIGQITGTVPPLSPVGATILVPVPAQYPFLTGDSVTFQAGSSGVLYFTINDDASGGSYSDNAGTMNVQLTSARSTPLLRISLAESNVVLTWPNIGSNYQLIQSDCLPGTNWSVVTNLPVISNGTNNVYLAPTNKWSFFQLQSQ
jgi:hypothetical protein